MYISTKKTFGKPNLIVKLTLRIYGFHFLLTFWCSPLVSAQHQNLTFEHFSFDDGLSAPVQRIIQDSSGFLWMATNDGLNRFDGHQFVIYRNIPGDTFSLLNNIINSLCADRKNRIWVATNGGLCYYDPGDDAFHKIHSPDTLEKIDRFRVHAVALGPEDNIWFATRSHFYLWTEGQPLHIYNLGESPELTITYLYPDPDGRIWIGANDGLHVFISSSEKFLYGSASTPFTATHHFTSTIHPILSGAADTIWIGSWYGGLQKVWLSDDALQFKWYDDPQSENPRKHILRGICKDPQGRLWTGSYGNGLSLFDPERQQFVARFHVDPANEKSLSTDYVNDVFLDRSGILWIGTDAGLDKYDPLTQQFTTASLPPLEGEFSVYRLPSAILEDPVNHDLVYIAVPGSGIYKLDTKNNASGLQSVTVDRQAHRDELIYTLWKDSHQRYWAGTRSGLFKTNSSLSVFDLIRLNGIQESFGVHTITEDQKGNLWLGTYSQGILMWNPESGETKVYRHFDDDPMSLPDDRVFCLHADHDGFIWIGTQNRGLARLDPVNDHFIFFEKELGNAAALPDNGVYDLYEDDKHQLWIATENGFAVMQLTDFSIKNYTTRDGLCHNDVFSITPGKDGYLWLATNNGLSRFHPEKNEFKNYFMSDGLPANRLSGATYFSTNGTLFLGTPGQITWCKPAEMKINTRMPPVVITRFRIFDRTQPLMRTSDGLAPIRLTHRDNMITFDFAALNFTNATLNEYAYRLEGFDEHWINVGHQQSATFTNLNGGTYTFHVRAANNDGIWNEEGAKVMITILPPYWRTWWFYVLCFLVVSSILYAAYRYRIGQLLKLQQIRMRISRDLHDDVGSTLSSIKMISGMAYQKPPAEQKADELFGTIYKASSQAMELMNDIVWSINPVNDRMEMILIRMRQYASEMLEAADIPFVLDMDEACRHLHLPLEKRKNFYLIYKEAINNLGKYSGATAASIHLTCVQGVLSLRVRDNGRGFNTNQPFPGNGLKNMRVRASQLKGRLDVRSSPGSGTEIELQFPLTP